MSATGRKTFRPSYQTRQDQVISITKTRENLIKGFFTLPVVIVGESIINRGVESFSYVREEKGNTLEYIVSLQSQSLLLTRSPLFQNVTGPSPLKKIVQKSGRGSLNSVCRRPCASWRRCFIRFGSETSHTTFH